MTRSKQGLFSQEVKSFYASIQARAVLIALEWVGGSASELGRLAGYDRYTGTKWVQRGAISAHGAIRLAKLPEFPLTVFDMVPDIQIDRYTHRYCPRCEHYIQPPHSKPGSSPLLKGSYKAAKKALSKRRSDVKPEIDAA